MTDSARHALHLFTVGFKDCLLGVLQIYRLDKEQRSALKAKEQQGELAQSTLARRRADRLKNKKESTDEESTIRSKIMWCSVFHLGALLLVMVAFEYVIVPGLECFYATVTGASTEPGTSWGDTKVFLSGLVAYIYVAPVFVLGKIVNIFWFQDIADMAYKHSRGRPQAFPSIGKSLADIPFSVIMQVIFLVQTTVSSQIPVPVVGYVFQMIQMSILCSVYAFEYSWFNRGWEVHKRLAFIEGGWPYFVGFGFPLAICTSAFSDHWVVNGCIFAVLFPLVIISAIEANFSVATYDFPLKLFGPAVYLTNRAFALAFWAASYLTGRRSASGGSSSKQTPVKQVKIAADAKKQY